ncbi:MAG: molybdopterin-dependent oxidoreductase [Candidatus Dormibacteraeota bacterium]|nr:molybdopterin-dependent oxidoreductase [Candidatus Dormibacteraeota bacterium]
MPRWVRGLVAGAAAGLGAVGAMEIVAAVLGTDALPQLIQAPLLALLPGAVFGFLIDSLQHWGKVMEEAGILVALVAVFAAAGVATAEIAARLSWWRRGVGIGAAAALWLLVSFTVLPLVGAGPMGLGGGVLEVVTITVPLALYGVVLQGLLAPPGRDSETVLDPGRRRVLGWGVAVLGAAVVAFTRIPAWAQSLGSGTTSGRGTVGPALTPAQDFYIVSKNFQDPVLEAAGWSIQIRGMVANPTTLTLSNLRSMPATTITLTQECISNLVGGGQISTGTFTGVPLRHLLDLARPQPGASMLGFTAADGYTETLDLQTATTDTQILVAYDLDGRPLPDQHGYPARILIPAHYGMRSPKWLTRINVGTSEPDGYWEQQGWNPSARVKTMSRIDAPLNAAVLPPGPVTVGGIAFAANRGIQRVEWSSDNGRTWRPATLEPPLSRLTWVLWHATWQARPGTYNLAARAMDGTGEWQTQVIAPSFPAGASGLHRIQVSIAAAQ